MDRRRALGNLGEDAAARHYRDLGFRVLERNYSQPDGEIDLIAAKGSTVVFCEVKTRRSRRFGAPAEAVDPTKQAKIRMLASRWLRARDVRAAEMRFEVVSVIVTPDRLEIDRIPDAF